MKGVWGKKGGRGKRGVEERLRLNLVWVRKERRKERKGRKEKEREGVRGRGVEERKVGNK
jgi:hypothetical protein